MNRREAIAATAAGLLGLLVPGLDNDGVAVWCTLPKQPSTRKNFIAYLESRGVVTYNVAGSQVRWKVKYRKK